MLLPEDHLIEGYERPRLGTPGGAVPPYRWWTLAGVDREAVVHLLKEILTGCTRPASVSTNCSIRRPVQWTTRPHFFNPADGRIRPSRGSVPCDGYGQSYDRDASATLAASGHVPAPMTLDVINSRARYPTGLARIRKRPVP